MIKKYLLLTTLISPFAAISLISCASNKVEINEEITTNKYLQRLNLTQIANLQNFKPFLFTYKNGKKIYLKDAKPNDNYSGLVFSNLKSEYIPSFETSKIWKQETTKFNNIKINEQDKYNPSLIDHFFTEYDFNDIKNIGGYNDYWFYFLANKYTHNDFYRIRDPYFFDFQTVIFRMVDDLSKNRGFLRSQSLENQDSQPYLLNFLFKNEYIQASSWLDDDHKEFRDAFVNFLTLYVNKFNLNIKEIKIDWSKAKIKKNGANAFDFIEFSIEDIITFDNTSIVNDLIKNKKFYINNFRNYATNLKFGVGESGLNESLPLFNDYVQNPYLRIKVDNDFNLGTDINAFIKGYDSLEFWNSRGIVYLFNNIKKRLILEVPDVYKEQDEKYEVIDVKFSDYYKTGQIVKAIIKVTKKDKTTKNYVLLSSNFDDHGHLLKGLAIKNAPINQLESKDYFIFREQNSPEFTGISIQEFIKAPLFNDLVAHAIEKTRLFWKNMHEVDVNDLDINNFNLKILTAYLNNYLLEYALENDFNKINSGIKKIELIDINKQENGVINLMFGMYKFINEQDFDFKTENEQPFYTFNIKLTGFKNFQNNK
ncbi:hypothetical protein KQ875_01690 [Mycoplasma zalophi]|uniref:Lipoprotein n=1 Tax=Mycoplasma zalophi TaxID=191287 RepID=A0ABS6DQU6_9MOLU|nr:hypothetical protein [Mycoplasma zalophi]MBU4692307.1 hypothetical protein [Mycoplasma zalophi]